MTGRLYMFRGSEADNDTVPTVIGMPRSYGDDRRRVPSAEPFFIDSMPNPLGPVSDWPARRAERIVTTSRGIAIGSAYLSPPPALSRDAEAIQRSFIEQDKQRETLFRKWRPILSTLALLAVFAGIGVLLAWRG